MGGVGEEEGPFPVIRQTVAKEIDMHATVVKVNIHDQVETKRALDEEFIPMLKQAPGFVGAYFVALDDVHGLSVQVFETEDQARAAAPSDSGPGMGGITLDSLEFGPVIGAV